MTDVLDPPIHVEPHDGGHEEHHGPTGILN